MKGMYPDYTHLSPQMIIKQFKYLVYLHVSSGFGCGFFFPIITLYFHNVLQKTKTKTFSNHLFSWLDVNEDHAQARLSP